LGLFDVFKKQKLTKEEYFDRGNTWLKEKQYKKAIADFTEVILLDFNYTDAYHKRGLAKVELEGGGISKRSILYSGAIDDFTKVIEIKPSSLVYFNRASVYVLLWKYKEAVIDYIKSMELYPNNEGFRIGCFQNIGIAKVNSGDYKEAITYLNKVIEYLGNDFEARKYKTEPHHLGQIINFIYPARVLYYRADAKFELGDKISAIKDAHLSKELGFEKATALIHCFENLKKKRKTFR
jgi:tetratricopeptide (TPR) repeat protein